MFRFVVCSFQEGGMQPKLVECKAGTGTHTETIVASGTPFGHQKLLHSAIDAAAAVATYPRQEAEMTLLQKSLEGAMARSEMHAEAQHATSPPLHSLVLLFYQLHHYPHQPYYTHTSPIKEESSPAPCQCHKGKENRSLRSFLPYLDTPDSPSLLLRKALQTEPLVRP